MKKKMLALLAAALILVNMSAFGLTALASDTSGETPPSSGEQEKPNGGEAPAIAAENVVIVYYRGEVIQVETVTNENDPTLGEKEIKQTSLIKIVSGKFTDRVYTLTNTYNTNDPKQIILKVGTNVMLTATLTSSGAEIASISIFDYYRTTQLTAGFVIMVTVILAVCLFKGIKSLAGIVVMSLGLYFYYVPLMLKGVSPVILMVPLCIVTGSMTILLDVGFSRRSLSAIAGMCAGLFFAGLAGYVAETQANLVGLGETELALLLYMPEHTPVSFAGITSAIAILISLGGIIDTTTGITEEMTAMKAKNPYITKMSLIQYGLSQGRFNMSRNLNTIFYTVLSCILPVWIIYVAYSTPLVEMMNMDFIASLLLRAFSAIIGVVLSMPVTAFVFAGSEKKGSMYS